MLITAAARPLPPGWWNGRHACLRSMCRKTWRFKSSPRHQKHVRNRKIVDILLVLWERLKLQPEVHYIAALFCANEQQNNKLYISGPAGVSRPGTKLRPSLNCIQYSVYRILYSELILPTYWLFVAGSSFFDWEI